MCKSRKSIKMWLRQVWDNNTFHKIPEGTWRFLWNWNAHFALNVEVSRVSHAFRRPLCNDEKAFSPFSGSWESFLEDFLNFLPREIIAKRINLRKWKIFSEEISFSGGLFALISIVLLCFIRFSLIFYEFPTPEKKALSEEEFLFPENIAKRNISGEKISILRNATY